MFAVLTILLPILVGLLTGDRIQQREGAPHAGLEAVFLMIFGVVAGIAASGASGLVGTLPGVIALIREEPQKWRPLVGLVVSVPVTLFALYLVATWANRSG